MIPLSAYYFIGNLKTKSASAISRINGGMKSFLVLLFFIFLCSCARKMDIIQTGPWSDKRDAKDIKYFVSRKQIKKPSIAIAVIRGEKFYPSDRKNINKQIEKAKKMAANIGADAVVLVEKAVPSGTSFPEDRGKVFLAGIAIKYVTKNHSKAEK